MPLNFLFRSLIRAVESGRVDRLAGALPMQRGGQPEEVTRAILWLLSDALSVITGSLLDVAGGR